MHPQYTYELLLTFTATNPMEAAAVKEEVKVWLSDEGVTSFVEGSLDELDIDHEWVEPDRDFYGELGGNASPLRLYSYQREFLLALETKILHAFPDQIRSQLKVMDTTTWMEGWKDSFKPIATRCFYIYPPWESLVGVGKRIPIIIDPGMAFGTGQHATTQVCLKQLEDLYPDHQQWLGKRLLDVGTGSGILAIAAKRLGCQTVAACDIDVDSIAAARENSAVAGVSLELWQGSLPSPSRRAREGQGSFDVVVANILFVVLAQIIEQLAAEVAPGGCLLLSGLLDEQRGEMLALAEAQGLRLVKESTQEGWAALVMSKPL